MITISLCTFRFCCSVWFFFLFFFDCATQHVGSWFPPQGLNPHCLRWRRGVDHRLTRGLLIWLLFMSAWAFSDSPCFFHQTLGNLPTSHCAPEARLPFLSLRVLLLGSVSSVVSFCIFSSMWPIPVVRFLTVRSYSLDATDCPALRPGSERACTCFSHVPGLTPYLRPVHAKLAYWDTQVT